MRVINQYIEAKDLTGVVAGVLIAAEEILETECCAQISWWTPPIDDIVETVCYQQGITCNDTISECCSHLRTYYNHLFEGGYR